ncbi:MAG: hypothetical protein R3Y33_03790, partial [Clostridia bacterium]
DSDSFYQNIDINDEEIKIFDEYTLGKSDYEDMEEFLEGNLISFSDKMSIDGNGFIFNCDLGEYEFSETYYFQSNEITSWVLEDGKSVENEDYDDYDTYKNLPLSAYLLKYETSQESTANDLYDYLYKECTAKFSEADVNIDDLVNINDKTAVWNIDEQTQFVVSKNLVGQDSYEIFTGVSLEL